MSDGRRILDGLRDLFQDGIDDLERAGARHLDDLADRGVRTATGAAEAAAEKVRQQADELRSGRRRTGRVGRVGREGEEASRSRDSFAEEGRRGRRKRRHKRDRKRGRRHERELDPVERESLRLEKRARRRANARIGFVTHFGAYLGTLALILVATRSVRVVAIVALGWGIGVFFHYLGALAAPRLRDRWIDREVGTRSARDVETERREVGTRSRRSLEDLSASIAHEIRNPITAAKSLVQQMGEDPASNENLEYADLALSELDRVERSISHLLRYARDEEPRFEQLELQSVTEAAVEGLRGRAQDEGVEIDLRFEGVGEIRGDREKLRRVLENLIANAIDAIAEASVDTPRVEILGGENLAGNEIWLRVLDPGTGIEPADRERIWSPFFTTKEKGTGLGLALSRKTIEAHGGRIELVADSKSGTEFLLSFPKDPNAEVGPARPQGGEAE